MQTLAISPFRKPPSQNLKSLQIDSAADAYAKVVAGAGCSLHRDSIDQSLIDQVKSLGKEGKIISDVKEIGGPGEIQGGQPAKDLLDLKEAGPINADGYTQLEVYLNDLAAGRVVHSGLP